MRKGRELRKKRQLDKQNVRRQHHASGTLTPLGIEKIKEIRKAFARTPADRQKRLLLNCDRRDRETLQITNKKAHDRVNSENSKKETSFEKSSDMKTGTFVTYPSPQEWLAAKMTEYPDVAASASQQR